MTDLGVLSGNNSSFAVGINNAGQVVGQSDGNGPTQAFVWDSIHGMQNLNSLLDSSSAGWQLQGAWSINSANDIVGYGINSAGDQHGFLLTPVPEPGNLVLFSMGMASIGVFSWMKERKTKVVAT